MNQHASCAERTPLTPAVSRFDLCRAALWDEAARRLVVSLRRPSAVLETLIAADHLDDAIRFLAMVLPKRQSIWWGALCVADGYGNEIPEEDLAALEATLLWLREPSESNRRAAETAGNQVTAKTPAGALAIAAFMSGGSISLPHLPFVAPAPEVTGNLVAGAILLAAVHRDWPQYREHYREYLAIGKDVADGHLGWLAAPKGTYEEVSLLVDPPRSAVPAPHFSADHHHHSHAPKRRAKTSSARKSSRS